MENLTLAYLYLLVALIAAAISKEIMTIHHTKHHNTYVTNLNAGLEKLDAAMSANDVSAIIGLQGALKFNGGGHLVRACFSKGKERDCVVPRRSQGFSCYFFDMKIM